MQAVLTVRLPEVDLSFLNDFFSIAWGFKEPQKVAARLASKIRLKILYPISMGAAPTAHLNLPPELYSILGKVGNIESAHLIPIAFLAPYT